MIKSITFKSRKNNKSRFETVLVITEHGLRMVNTNHPGAKNTEEFIEYLLKQKRGGRNSHAEILWQSPMIKKSKQQIDFPFFAAPAMNTSASELFERYQTLTGQEKKILKLILRNYRQKAICKKLNIQLGTEKTYRKKVHEKMEIKDFSDLTDCDRDLLLKFTHEK